MFKPEFECIYVYGTATPELEKFILTLFKFWMDGQALRLPEDDLRYMYENSIVGGSEGIAHEICKTIGQSGMSSIPNKFPYTAVLEASGCEKRISHTVVFSATDSVGPEEMEQQMQQQFPGRPALMVINSWINKSLPELSHGHMFVDVGGKLY